MNKYNKKDFLFLTEKASMLYKKSCDDNLEDFPLSEREKFHKNGNRQDFEKLYFKRRDYLSATAVLALSDDSFVEELERILLGICKESSWALPAHTSGKAQQDKKVVDLFVCETAFALAEIFTVFKEKISAQTLKKVKDEIKARLVDNYINNTYWWENCKMNWAAVCGGCLGGTLLYMFPDEFEQQKRRIMGTLSCYIDGFTDDGFCFEGPSYWQYGFMAYSIFADLLYKFSSGKDDIFMSEKVKKIASYASNCILTGNTALSFSDAQMSFKPDFALQSYLHNKFPHTVPYPQECENLCDSNTKWLNYYRAVIWQGDGKPQCINRAESVYSSSANQLIVNKKNYSFAFKGGNNGEPHNHNDLGSFIYSDKSGQVFCDLGSGRYTKNYFVESERYGIFCNSSFSHSVPVINGKGQAAGEEYSAKLRFENNVAVCDVTNAYDEKGLTCFVRKAEIKQNGIILTDSFSFTKDISVTERFVSIIRAEIKNGTLVFGNTKMLYPKNKVTLFVKKEKHTPHEYDKEDITVYCYDFVLNEGVSEIALEIITK